MMHIRFLDCWFGLPITAAYLSAFPACWLISRSLRPRQNAGRHDKRSLICASFVLYQTWFLCCPINTELELLRYVSDDRQTLARGFDICVAVGVFALALPMSLWVSRGLIEREKRNIERDLHQDAASLRRNEYIEEFSETMVTSTWFMLLLCYLITLTSGLVTLAMSTVLSYPTPTSSPNTIPWPHYPLYNIASHIALFHVALGMMDTIMYNDTCDSVRAALSCKDAADRSAYWTWLLSDGVRVRSFIRAIVGAVAQRRDIETPEAGAADEEARVGGKGSEKGAKYGTFAEPAPAPPREESRGKRAGFRDCLPRFHTRRTSRAYAKYDLRRWVLETQFQGQARQDERRVEGRRAMSDALVNLM